MREQNVFEMVIGKKQTLDDNCGVNGCNDAAREAADAGIALSTVSTIAFAAGAVGLGVGTYLFITSSPAGRPAPVTALGAVALPGGAGLAAAHTF